MQIQRKTLAQEVAERLIEGISNDEYAIGEKLPIESELMKIYGVGRSSIREAIKILSIQGILNVQQGVGTFVVSKNAHESLESQMNKAQIEEVQEVRSLLDSKIAKQETSYDKYDLDSGFVTIHGIKSEIYANDVAKVLKENKKYNLVLYPAVIISSDNYSIVQINKNLEAYLAPKTP